MTEKQLYEKAIALLRTIENDDSELDKLEKAMHYYCSTWDMCEGYKYALRMTLEDQFEHHAGENSPDDYKQLIHLLT